jgi:integrase
MGDIKKRNNKFQARVRKGPFKNNGLTKTFISRVEAKKWIRDVESKLDKSDFIPKQNINYPTLKGLMNQYLSKVSKHKASYQTDVANFKTFSLLFEDLNIPINKLTARMFARFRDRYMEEHKASTYQRLMSSIKHMWKVARTEWEYPLENILERVRTPKRDNPRDRRLSIPEYNKILYGNHTDYEFRNLILLVLATGLRLGEISGIRREHIDGNTLLIPKRKNGDTNVKVPLSDNAQSVLKNMELPIKLKKRGIQIKWSRLMKKYEIEDLHFHDLRHEAISKYLENGVSIQDVQVLSGHRDIRVLMRVYANLRPNQVASKLNI